MTSLGHIYSRRLAQNRSLVHHYKLLYDVTGETKIHFAIE